MSDHLGSAAAHQQPTPYPEVNVVVHDLLTSLHAILGAQLVGMYLVGSLALGDFDPQKSDLDLVIVTVGALPDKTVAALRDLHQRFDHSASAWAARLDIAYLPQEDVRETSATVAAARYPILQWPELLALGHLEGGWPIWRDTLREHGVVVSGPDPRSLVDPVQPDDLRRASAAKPPQTFAGRSLLARQAGRRFSRGNRQLETHGLSCLILPWIPWRGPPSLPLRRARRLCPRGQSTGWTGPGGHEGPEG